MWNFLHFNKRLEEGAAGKERMERGARFTCFCLAPGHQKRQDRTCRQPAVETGVREQETVEDPPV